MLGAAVGIGLFASLWSCLQRPAARLDRWASVARPVDVRVPTGVVCELRAGLFSLVMMHSALPLTPVG